MKQDEVSESIVFGPDTTYSPLFWDGEGVAIGDYDSFFIENKEYSTSSLMGLREWFMKAGMMPACFHHLGNRNCKR